MIGESFGALVGGGSIVTMPALLLTGLPLQSAIAIDNAASLGTEAGIFSSGKDKVFANKRLTVFMAIPMTIGGVVGTWLLLSISADVIKYLIAATVVALLIYSYTGRHTPAQPSKAHYTVLALFLLCFGVYSNFIAAGEGAFTRLGIMMILGLKFIDSTAIKATATMPSRVYSLIVTAISGLIVWPYLLTMWVSNFVAGRYATKFAAHIPDRLMQVFLTVVSLVFVVYLLVIY